eukprot:SAG11_NODE_360_length_10188_cov_25.643671_2_plen_121_part_00
MTMTGELDTTLTLPELDATLTLPEIIVPDESEGEPEAQMGEHNLCAKRNLVKLARRALLFRRGYPALREYLEGVATKLDGSGQTNRHALRRLALDPEVTDDVQSLMQDKWHKTMRDSDIR